LKDKFISSKSEIVSPKPLSMKEAYEFFCDLADKRTMAWGYVRVSCYPKAYLACEEALRRGHHPMKAWAFARDKDHPISGQHPSGGAFNWDRYHVAMALPVDMEKGRSEKMVFDPTLFDAPVTLEEWRTTIGADADRVDILDYKSPVPSSLTGSSEIRADHSVGMTAQAQSKLMSWWSAEPDGERLVHPSRSWPDHKKRRNPPEAGWQSVSARSSVGTTRKNSFEQRVFL
jgi:hypothetical protein